MKQTKRKRDNYRVPKSVQDLLPVTKVWKDGTFQVGSGLFSKSYRFSDINYRVASDVDKEDLFSKYCALLNALDPNAEIKITINNHTLNQRELEENVMIPMRGDLLDEYRMEYNEVLRDKMLGEYRFKQEKYITVMVRKKSVEEARGYFRRVGAELGSRFAALGSVCEVLDAKERLRILHDVYRTGEEEVYHLDLSDLMRKGHDFRDYICPDGMEQHRDYLMIGNKYARVLYLKNYANVVTDELISQLTDMSRNMMLSIDVTAIPPDEAIKDIQKKLLSVETNIANWQKRQNANNHFTAIIPYDMALQRKETTDFLDDLVSRDQRMMMVTLTLFHLADSKEQLDQDTERFQSIARERLCQLAVMNYEQMDAFQTVLPVGPRRVHATRTLNTESLGILIPYKTQEVQEKGGIYMGENAISGNPIVCNPDNLMNQSMFLLGVPGAGKSFFAKLLITFLALATDDDILVCDPESEYTSLIEALGGSVIRIATGGSDHVNAMDMTEGYGNKNPIADKSEFILSLVEQIDKQGIRAHQKSLIDRCVELCFREAKTSGRVPTLCMLREKLMEQPEQEAGELALALELFTDGSLDIFAHETNVDTVNRIQCYDIHELGPQLKPAGLLTITDAMLNRVAMNARKGRKTHIVIDEFHVVYENEYSANFFSSAWRQFRKRNAQPCAITQNVTYLLDSPQANSMLANSEFVVMLNQAAQDQARLCELLNISGNQRQFFNNVSPGSGLMKYGGIFVPFVNQFPKDTKLYKLITTKPDERLE
ncbi:MAG: ATP-binding protein [Lachnospiraceae bacterium]|nr:ATP-binding protein [Lachnospiraceae bacterium]